MAVVNGLTLITNTNLIIPTTSGTPVNGTIKLNGNILQIYYNTVWCNIC